MATRRRVYDMASADKLLGGPLPPAGASAVIEVRGGKQWQHADGVVAFPLRTSHGRGV